MRNYINNKLQKDIYSYLIFIYKIIIRKNKNENNEKLNQDDYLEIIAEDDNERKFAVSVTNIFYLTNNTLTITKLETDDFVQITKILFQILMFLCESKIIPRKKFCLSIGIFIRSNTIFFNSSIILLKY